MKWSRTSRSALLGLACAWAALTHSAETRSPQQTARAKPTPDFQNVKYGPHERNVIDLWQAKSEKPAPLVVFIHGGGFRGGDKSNLAPSLLSLCLESGISVAAINYRLSQHAPFPAPMLDSARAIQFLRSRAKEWNLDSKRLAATGGSAGAGISLWIGFHDDLADPKSDDPVSRQSTRLTCMGVVGAQCSYDPRFIKRVVGGRAHEHPALAPFYGLGPDELDTSRAYRLYEEAAPITYVSADDPPVFLFYSEEDAPLPSDAKPGQGIHHPNFGKALKERLAPLKIECVLRHRDDYKDGKRDEYPEMVEFFKRHFAGGPSARSEQSGSKKEPNP